MTAERALKRLLESVGAGPLDVEIAGYLESALEPENIDDSAVEVLQEVLSGACQEFSAIDPQRQTSLILSVIEEVQTEHCTGSSEAAAGPAPLALPQLADAVGLTDSSDEQQEQQEQQEQRPCKKQDYSSQLQTMSEVCESNVCCEFLLHVLLDQSGDLQAAVTWLLDCPNLTAAQHRWQQEEQEALQAAEAAAAEQQRQRKLLVQKYDLQVVPDGSSKPHPLQVWPSKKQDQKAPKVRYRDGCVVTSKGEKYVVEKVGEEWDGGSRGKVYTKGKRGKGFA